MRFSISQTALADALAKGGLVAQRTGDVPMLAGVRLTTKNNTLFVASTDGNRFAEIAVSAEVETHGAIVVNAALLSSLIARYSKDATVSFDLEAPGALRVKCGRSRPSLPVLPAAGFPEWGQEKKAARFTISGRTLADALARLKPISGRAPLQWEGTAVEAKDGALNVAAFDGFMIGWLKLPLPDGAEGSPTLLLANVSVDAFIRLFKIEPEVTATVTEEVATFEANGVRLSTKLLIGKPPPYTLIESQRSETTVTFDKSEFLLAQERAVLTAETEGALNRIVVEPITEGLKLTSRSHKGGDGDEFVAAEVSEGFQTFAVNPAFLPAIAAGVPDACRLVIEEVVYNSRYLVYAEGDETFIAGFAPLVLGRG